VHLPGGEHADGGGFGERGAVEREAGERVGCLTGDGRRGTLWVRKLKPGLVAGLHDLSA
jgi:hypothetical protein